MDENFNDNGNDELKDSVQMISEYIYDFIYNAYADTFNLLSGSQDCARLFKAVVLSYSELRIK